MKILQINTVYAKGSTGKIAKGIHDICKANGDECITGHRFADDKNAVTEDAIAISSWWDCHVHNRLVKYTRRQGCYSYFKTKRFLKKIDKFSPDVIHLHNLHGSYINLPLLFRYIKKHNIKTVWTLHDCWALTGQCPHFIVAGCDKWKTECHHCPQYKALGDPIRKMHTLKKKLFLGIDDLTIVTPSQWSADLVKQSFLKDYPVVVINNGIDLTVFQPTKSDFREKHGIPAEKKILLGVSFGWGYKKGLDVFIELAKRLDPAHYQIVLVGTNEATDAQLPSNIISIHRTNDQKELAGIYTASDLFVNPTREEVFGLVNVEANACGTPVLTFRTGGSPECIDSTSGSVVDCNDIDAMEKEIKRICTQSPFSAEACISHAKRFDMYARFSDYISLYKEVEKE